VKHKRKRHRRLQQDLGHNRQRREARRQSSGIPMPAQQRRDQVAEAEDVEAAAENGTGDAVQNG
jgi:hypothetical protein